MNIKYIAATSLLAVNLFANVTNTSEMPNVLEFEKILKKGIDKKDLKESVTLPTLPVLESPSVDFNLTGTITIGNTKYCYLVVEANKIIKATTGMTIKNKKIVDINDYGITVNDGKSELFIPILSSQVQERDIVFTNREKVKNMNQENQEN